MQHATNQENPLIILILTSTVLEPRIVHILFLLTIRMTTYSGGMSMYKLKTY